MNEQGTERTTAEAGVGVEQVKALVVETLELDRGEAEAIGAETRLFGALPEFDSLAVLELIAAMEERFGTRIEADEVTAETFESVAALTDFVNRKRRAAG